jgi:hypothetical protein
MIRARRSMTQSSSKGKTCLTPSLGTARSASSAAFQAADVRASRALTWAGAGARRCSRNEHLVSRTKSQRPGAGSAFSERKREGLLEDPGTRHFCNSGAARHRAPARYAAASASGTPALLALRAVPRLLMNPPETPPAGRFSFCTFVAAACRAPRPSRPHAQARGDTRLSPPRNSEELLLSEELVNQPVSSCSAEITSSISSSVL